jgi:hypothetical protein
MFASSRPTAFRFHRLIAAVGICSAALSVSAAPALARGKQPQTLATCEGQSFAQQFEAYGDSNYYTLAPGGEFNSASEGWELSNGAQIVETTRPDGTTGGVLNMPSGSVAVSPPVCVTLQYPTARVSVRDVNGSEGVAVAVAYANTKTAEAPKNVGQVHGQQSSWTLSNPFNVQPQTAGHSEETREVRFVFTAKGKTSDFQLSGLYVDPRMV